MNRDALQSGFVWLGAEYGVHPVVFGGLCVRAIPFFAASVVWPRCNLR